SSSSSMFFLYCPLPPPALPSFPTRRSSDLLHRNLLDVFFTDHATGRHRHFAHLFLGDHFANLHRHLVFNPFYNLPTNRHGHFARSEEHTSELQSRGHLVCRLLLEKKKK